MNISAYNKFLEILHTHNTKISRKIGRISAGVALFIAAITGDTGASEMGLIRTIPVDTPKKAVLRVSNSSYYSKIKANDILKTRYGVTKSNILSSITDVEFGITDYLAINGTFPYFADVFEQNTKGGEKTGGGDIAAGLRLAYAPEESMLRGLSLGTRFLIPEKLVYGQEPLGFRVFSSGEFGYSIEAAFGLGLKYMDGYFSAAMQKFPKAPAAETAFPADVFYDTGFGYRGIGPADQTGFAPTLFQDQFHLSFTGVVPVRPWLAAFVEYSTTAFISKPQREEIVRFAPGIRVGKADKLNASFGMDFGVSGPVPDKTFLFRLHIPSISPRGIKDAIKKKIISPGERARAQNSYVAVKEFSRSDFTYLYDKELRDSFQKKLGSAGLLNVVPGNKVDTGFQQQSLVPIMETPTDFGVRIGAGYLISTDIAEYTVSRSSRFTIPLLIGFPKTDFSIRARASLTDLVTGDNHDLGEISATVFKERGVHFFPAGKSSDIIYLSDPERRTMEKRLVDEWVDQFNERLMERIDLFNG